MVPFEDRLLELTPEQRELFELFLKKERISIDAARDHRPPSNPTEQRLAAIWAELLGIEAGVDDNYFELGGDSITIIHMVSLAAAQGIALRTEWVFSNPTIAGLAALSHEQERPVVPAVARSWPEQADRLRHADPEFWPALKRTGARPVDAYPLTALQQGILYHTLEGDSAGAYLVQWRFTLTGPLDLARFRRAWARVIERHEAFRTVFMWIGLDEPTQVVLDRADAEVLEQDVEGAPERSALQAFEDDRRAGFDLRKAPLMRIRFVREGADRWLCCWTHHHLILDGWSQQIFVKEFFAAYRGEDLPPVTPGVFREHVYALRSIEDPTAVAFWQRQFAGYRPPSTSREAAAVTTHTVMTRTVADSRAVRAAAARESVTLSAVYQAAWALGLAQLRGDTDVAFGVTCSGRSSGAAGIADAVGPFINTLPLRLLIDPSMPLNAFVQAVQREQAQLVRYEWCGLPAVQQWIGWDARTPLVDSVYVYERFPVDLSPLEVGEQLAITDVRTSTHEHYPLVFIVEDNDDTTRLTLKYAPADQDAMSRVERLLDAITGVASRLIDSPFLTVADCLSVRGGPHV